MYVAIAIAIAISYFLSTFFIYLWQCSILDSTEIFLILRWSNFWYLGLKGLRRNASL